MFTLRDPLTDSILIATDTGIAPMRGFVQQLFPENAPASTSQDVWLVCGADTASGLYYQDYFEKVEAQHPNFHYVKTLSHAPAGWQGEHEHVQDIAVKVAAEQSAQHPPAEGSFHLHAYVCGLNEMVSATRAKLKASGLDRKQIVFERYD